MQNGIMYSQKKRLIFSGFLKTCVNKKKNGIINHNEATKYLMKLHLCFVKIVINSKPVKTIKHCNWMPATDLSKFLSKSVLK